MRALVWQGPGDVRYEERPAPSIAGDEILIRVSYAGICGSEIHIIDGHLPTSRIKPPQVLGHEFSGIVAEIGEDVSGIQVGQRVTAHPWVGCGQCYYCREGLEHFCTNPFNVLTNAQAGAFAEYTAVKAKQVYLLPEEMSLEEAALVEPFSIALHAVDISNIKAGYSVAILGAGMIGLTCLELAQHTGAAYTLISDLCDSRLAIAREFGADRVVNPAKEDLLPAVMQATDGLGVHTCIEAVGVKATMQQAPYLTRKCGMVLMVGLAPSDMTIEMNPYDMNMRELAIQCSRWSPYSFNRTLALMPKVNTKGIITHVLPFSQIEEALAIQRAREGIKILLHPD